MHFACPLSYGHDRDSFEDGITLVHMDCSDGACMVGFDGILHLHGLKHSHLLSCFDRVSHFDGNLDNHSRER